MTVSFYIVFGNDPRQELHEVIGPGLTTITLGPCRAVNVRPGLFLLGERYLLVWQAEDELDWIILSREDATRVDLSHLAFHGQRFARRYKRTQLQAELAEHRRRIEEIEAWLEANPVK